MKKHYKLYKSGKKWCIAAIVALTFSLGFALTANADDVAVVNNNEQSAVKINSDSNSVTQQISVNDTQLNGNLSSNNSSASLSSNSEVSSTASSQSGSSDTNNNQAYATQEVQNSATALTAVNYAASATNSVQNGWVTLENGQKAFYRNGKLDQGLEYVQLPSLTNPGQQNWYLLNNGIAQSRVQKWYGTYYYFDPVTYLRVDHNYVQSQWGLWYMFGNDGRIVTGVYNWMGNIYYFDPNTYLRVDNQYISTLSDGRGYLFGGDGAAVSGVYKWVGTYYYFDPVTHLRVDNDYRQQVWPDGSMDWYMFGSDGRIVTGPYSWQGSLYYFDPSTYLRVDNDYRVPAGSDRGYLLGKDGRALSGIQNWMGSTYYFDPSTYLLVKNSYFYVNGQMYWANNSGIISKVNDNNAINRYIVDTIGLHNHAQITYDYVIPQNVTGSYSRTSDGKPDMVIVHETANPNDSIQGEINYERNTYRNAFVHAFVDNNNIIQISDTDHEAWGAAYPANGRAVQFEQVEVYGKDAFAHELMNAAYYTAFIMKKYNMVPSLASNGNGTLWSHHYVSQFLGGTNHTDPDGYWSNRANAYFGTNYTMADFYQLVELYYNE